MPLDGNLIVYIYGKDICADLVFAPSTNITTQVDLLFCQWPVSSH